MGVTFRVSKQKPSVYQKGGSRSSSSPSALPPYHYLNSVREYSSMGYGELLQESEWDADKTFPIKNGFVNTVVRAYNGHHNLVLRPDDVWLAIVVQFSAFVNGNAAELRHLFVSHEGKKELVVVHDESSLQTVSFSEMALSFVGQLRKNIKDPDLADWILPDFTTTTSDDTIVSSVVMMATLKEYFHYSIRTRCGIPEVTLLGTVEDWRKLAGRLDKLGSFGPRPAEWAKMLQGVLRQFVSAAQGDADVDFWERICSNHGGGSGPSYISGWMTTFCVFDSEGKWRGDRRELRGNVISEYPVVETGSIPTGHVTVPVKVQDSAGEHKTVMFAGHMLAELVTETTLSPKATWAIVMEKEEEEEKKKKKKKKKTTEPEATASHKKAKIQ